MIFTYILNVHYFVCRYMHWLMFILTKHIPIWKKKKLWLFDPSIEIILSAEFPEFLRMSLVESPKVLWVTNSACHWWIPVGITESIPTDGYYICIRCFLRNTHVFKYTYGDIPAIAMLVYQRVPPPRFGFSPSSPRSLIARVLPHLCIFAALCGAVGISLFF